jgi:hypothetical protein
MLIVVLYLMCLVGWAMLSVAFDRWQQPLRRVSIIRIFLTMIVTLGYFYPIWFLRRRAALNRLDSTRKVSTWPFVVTLGCMILREIGILAWQAQTVPAWLQLSFYPLAILMLVEGFFVKDILEEHLMGPSDDPGLQRYEREAAELSGILTFFFGIFYLQHAINSRILGRQPAALPQQM